MGCKCRTCNYHFHVSCAEHTTTCLRLKVNGSWRDLCYIDHSHNQASACNLCNRSCKGAFYRCIESETNFHVECILPSVMNHESHDHPLVLTNSVVLIGNYDKYRCDICEEEIDIKAHFYYCEECIFIAHVACVLFEENPLQNDESERQQIGEVEKTEANKEIEEVEEKRSDEKEFNADSDLVEEKMSDEKEFNADSDLDSDTGPTVLYQLDEERARKMRSQSQKANPLETGAAISTMSSTGSDEHLPNSHTEDQFVESYNFDEYLAIYEEFQDQQKCCLLSFADFPENAVVKKRLLVYWWIAEGFLDSANTGGSTVEDIATKILDGFMADGFILPVNRKRKMEVNRFKMDPRLRSLVIKLAQEEKFFNYDSEGKLTCKCLESKRACLLNAEKIELENHEKIRTLFNVNQETIDFRFHWFSKMRNVQVLCLGMCQSSAEYHYIAVENTKFLNGLKNMEQLRFLSLHRIYNIEKLPSRIRKLRNLRILDLRACYNLELLPKEVGSLKMLTHLDISECSFLDHMPKELRLLSQLQVFKGFVIADESDENFCSLADLAGLKKLRKLSIHIYCETFYEEDLSTLYKFKQLEQLKIVWGTGGYNKYIERNRMALARQRSLIVTPVRKQDNTAETSPNLQKLDLQYFPEHALPSWLLNPERLTGLKKLYIRGGGLSSLSKYPKETVKWETVEVLRLNYLSGLKINWIELTAIFPNLNYLEKFRCPKVSFCPCNRSGVWKYSTN